MKASVLTRPGVIEYCDVETPEPAEGEVRVAVAYCGICGSDIPRVLQGTAHSYPLILGHEFSGVVDAVGQGVDPALVGTRVAGIPLVPCGVCPDCASGNYSLCKSYSFIGSRRAGAFAQYVCVPQENVYPIGDDVPFDQAAFFEPACVAAHAIDLVDFRPGTTAVVVGCGTIGIFLSQILMDRGAARVVGLSRRASRRDAALAAGVPEMIDTSTAGWRDELLATLPAGGFDYVFDTSGNYRSMPDSFALAANKGTVCFVGTPKEPMLFSVQQWELMNRRELMVTGSWMSYSAPFPGKEWSYVADAFARKVLRVTPDMVDTVAPLADLRVCFEKLSNRGSVTGKLLVSCSDDLR